VGGRPIRATYGGTGPGVWEESSADHKLGPMRFAPKHLITLPKPPPPISPAQLEHARERAENEQNRIADAITRFAGSMTFVYLHVLWFVSWIVFGVEDYPYGLLTMIVSLEAIFLSTFVMISQNRADAKRQVIANEQWKTVQEEDLQNQELLGLSNQILSLVRDVHELSSAEAKEHTQNGR
jgi:uncharacterized membrane protein